MLRNLATYLPPIRYQGESLAYVSLSEKAVVDIKDHSSLQSLFQPLGKVVTIIQRHYYLEFVRVFPLPSGRNLSAAIKFEAQTLKNRYQNDVIHYVLSSNNSSTVYFFVLGLDQTTLAGSGSFLIPETLALMLDESLNPPLTFEGDKPFILYKDQTNILRSAEADTLPFEYRYLIGDTAHSLVKAADKVKLIVSGLKRLNLISVLGLRVERKSTRQFNPKDFIKPGVYTLAFFAAYLALTSAYLVYKESSLDTDIAALSSDIAEASELRNQANDIEQQVSQLQAVADSESGIVELMAMVADMPRNDLILKSFKIEGAVIEIRGKAESATVVFEFFSKQSRIESSKFFEPVYKSQDGLENFGIQLVLK